MRPKFKLISESKYGILLYFHKLFEFWYIPPGKSIEPLETARKIHRHGQLRRAIKHHQLNATARSRTADGSGGLTPPLVAVSSASFSTYLLDHILKAFHVNDDQSIFLALHDTLAG